jgi:hypothetical protein
MKTLKNLLPIALFLMGINISAQKFNGYELINNSIYEYEKSEWNINLSAPFTNPFNAYEISVDMLLTSPAGKQLVLPCFFSEGDSIKSCWKSRFAPQDTGVYDYFFRITLNGKTTDSKKGTFMSKPSGKTGFLHKNNFWTFKFDNGKPFRGIGENVGWESRTWENKKWTYDYLLPTLSRNGANFFRTWMCAWNLPLEWKQIRDTRRYQSTGKCYNPDGMSRMDKLVQMTDSLGLFIMLTLDWHGELISNAEWKTSSYNIANGGPANSPTEFFTSEEAQNKYKNKLRYVIARWGYSTSIAAWEFFNEIDNAAFTLRDSIIIPHAAITQWHDEMSMYLKNNDPYNHLVTTSISHRDIIGLNTLANIDFNQKHIYKHTERIPSTINNYSSSYNKPYVIGEFGYEWDWNLDFNPIASELEFDYKRGLWYGLFSPTPILPMTWWWEFFDERGMTSYFKGVKEINDIMLVAGNGTFEQITAEAGHLESYSVKCGKKIFVYLLNNTATNLQTNVVLRINDNKTYKIKTFKPLTGIYKQFGNTNTINTDVSIPKVSLDSKDEIVLILE